MQRREWWGYVQFSSLKPGTVKFQPDRAWDVRCRLHEVYYAQRAFRDSTGRWPRTLDELHLGCFVLAARGEGLSLQPTGEGYIATMPLRLPDGRTQLWRIRQDALIRGE